MLYYIHMYMLQDVEVPANPFYPYILFYCHQILPYLWVTYFKYTLFVA